MKQTKAWAILKDGKVIEVGTSKRQAEHFLRYWNEFGSGKKYELIPVLITPTGKKK